MIWTRDLNIAISYGDGVYRIKFVVNLMDDKSLEYLQFLLKFH